MGGVTASRENSGNRSLSSHASGSIAGSAASAAILLRGDDCAQRVDDRMQLPKALRSPASLVGLLPGFLLPVSTSTPLLDAASSMLGPGAALASVSVGVREVHTSSCEAQVALYLIPHWHTRLRH